MKLPLPSNPFLRFLFCFACWYAALLSLWPLVGGAYCTAFRSIGSLLYAENSSAREISLEPFQPDFRPYDTRVVIVNPARMKPDGSGPVRHLDLDTLAFGGLPLTLLLALVLATPIPWRSRLPAMLWGLFWQQTFVFTALGCCIWSESSEVGLVSLSPAWKATAQTAREMLTYQIALAAPFVIWLLVAFRGIGPDAHTKS